MTKTNIKGLPEGRRYFTEIGHSQKYPWVEVKHTAKTVTLAKVRVKRDPDWQPEIVPGGFAGHCTNQHDQTWLFDRIDETEIKTIRRVRSRTFCEAEMWAHKGTRFIEGQAVEFYDYNF